MELIIPECKDVKLCAKVYISAYQAEPWNEVYEETEVENYIANYMGSDTKCCFAMVESGEIIGVALGLIVPSIPCPYLRIEDFCMASEVQRKGYGSVFMDLILKEAGKLGCDSILVGTQRDFPSHHFYLKNGFEEIESVLLYKEIK